MTYDLEIADKLEELSRLVRKNKLLSGQEEVKYEPQSDGSFLPLVYSVTFVVMDEKTNLPVTVTIKTPVEKKND